MKNTKQNKEKEIDKEEKLVEDLKSQYSASYEALESIRSTWDEKEAMLLGKTLDSSAYSAKSRVYDPRLSSIVFERMSRVMAQTPTGRVQSLTKQDTGKNLLINLALQKYVIPNANTQYDILTKFKLLDIYSLVYGSMFALVDYVKNDAYQGPDFHIIPIRNIMPQVGKYTLEACDYVFVRSEVSREWLQSQKTDKEGSVWKNIDEVLEYGSGSERDTKDQTYSEKQDPNGSKRDTSKKSGIIEIITRYDRKRWITFCASSGHIIRNVENPQKNGKLPVVAKHAFPLLDRFFGLGEFERGRSLQNGLNSLWNLYLDSVKMSLFPPLKVYLPDVVPSTLRNEPSAIIALKTNNPGAITPLQVSPQGLSTFTSTYQYMVASLQNQAGSTDTSISSGTDPTQGKTPQALKMQQSRESARDNFDRFMMEKTIEQIYDRFVDLLAKAPKADISFSIFEEDIKLIQKQHPDVNEMLTVSQSGKYGDLTIKKDALAETNYKFYIDTGTTTQKDAMIENDTLASLFGLILKLPGAPEQAIQSGKVNMGNVTIDIGEAIKRYIISSQLPEWDKIVLENDMEQPAQPMPAKLPQPQQQTPVEPQPAQNPSPEQSAGLSPESLSVLEEIKNYGRTSSQ